MPLAGLEPARCYPLDFESSASANSATVAQIRHVFYLSINQNRMQEKRDLLIIKQNRTRNRQKNKENDERKTGSRKSDDFSQEFSRKYGKLPVDLSNDSC